MRILIVLLSLTTTIAAIRVPTVWPSSPPSDKPISHRKLLVQPQPQLQLQRYPNGFQQIPHNSYVISSKPKPHMRKYKKTYPKKYQSTRFFRNPIEATRVPLASNDWMPIAPFSINTRLGYMPPRPNITIDLTQYPKEHYLRPSRIESSERIREDDGESEEQLDEELNIPNEEESIHENPRNVPTAPIYPGEGEWAKRGRKHKPFISEHQFSQLKDDSSEGNTDGYEIFKRGEQLFNKKRAKFESTPRQNDKRTNDDKSRESLEENESNEENDDDAGSEFVPMTMYSQVRRSEDEEHLPTDDDGSEGGRLKEVIRDSKILTVYTEEGYEDSAYDHAGHEKNAEDSQGYKDYIEEKEKQKQKRPKKNDQDEDGSTKVKVYVEPETSETSYEKTKQKRPRSKNNFLKTEETKTKSLGEDADGRAVEITKEFKVMEGPNNGTKIEKVVEVKPTILKYLDQPTTTPLYNLLEIVFPTINTTNSGQNSTQTELSRAKRFANDFPELNVEKDFTYDIHERDVPEYREEAENDKYPYYNSKHINPDSPLRYSENLRNIPKKVEGKMSFYEHLNKIECPEVDSDVEEIPENPSEVRNNGGAPRLGKLGQKIDCFKRKYFGENPLDSPIFQEEEVKPIAPIFAGFQSYNANGNIGNTRNRKYHSKFSIDKMKKNNMNFNPSNSEEVSSSREHPKKTAFERQPFIKQETVEVINVDDFGSINAIHTEKPPKISLLTTPNYQVDVTPKHIYDQIDLLEHLPEDIATYAPPPTTATKNVKPHRKPKYMQEESGESVETAKLILRQPPKYQKFTPRRRQRINYRNPQQNFDVNSYLSEAVNTNNFENVQHKVPLEQLNVYSDVLNNIKNGTNDPFKQSASTYQRQNQFNTYSNFVGNNNNNINNNNNNQARIKVPQKKIRIKTPNTIDDRNLYHLTSSPPPTTSTTTKKPRRGAVRFASTTEDYDYEDPSEYGKKNIRQKFTTPSPTQPKQPVQPVQPIPVEEDNEDSDISETHLITTELNPIEKSTEIYGLVPPSKWQYKTIFTPDNELEPEISESENINHFYVAGMKPPSKIPPQHFNFNFKPTGKAGTRYIPRKHHHRRRGKRSPNRRSYFEVVRNSDSARASSNADDDDDDYVPHRPKNWHWDEKLKKIVYDSPRKEEVEVNDEDDDVEIVEIEVTDPTPTNIQATTARRRFTTTTEINGPSYVDYIKTLKSNKKYVSIPDPTTTKEGIKPETTTIPPSTTSSGPTKPPEFLSFVSQLRKSDSYKKIDEKNKTRTTTTTEEPEIIEDDDEEFEDSEPALSNVQNSPGRGAVDVGNYKMFNVNDFIPSVKTYSPRTSIDYSKYKTIQRSRPRQSTTTPTPTPPPVSSTELNEFPGILTQVSPSTTEGKVEIIELSRGRKVTTTSTTTPTTPTTSTSRPQRVRGRRPSTSSPKVTSSTSPRATSSTEETVYITAEKPKRVYRRRPVHIRTRTNEEKEPKIVRRRHNSDSERHPKVVSLETVIERDNKNANSTIDDIVKDINELKEVKIVTELDENSTEISDYDTERNFYTSVR